MTRPALTAGGLHAAVASAEGRSVAVAGPSGVGKTGVLLCLMAHGCRPVAFEQAEITPDGLTVRDDNVRIRARHLRLVRDAIRLTAGQRAWLWIGALGSHLPVIGGRIGRRCFVDVPAGAVRSRTTATGLDVLVVLDPEGGDGPRPADADDLAPYLGPGADAPEAWVLGTADRSTEDVAAAVLRLVRPC